MFAPVEQSLPFDSYKYTNRNLFSEHFLSHPQHLREMEEWKQDKGLKEAFDRIRQLYRRHAARFNSHTNEAQTEKDFIRPVLDILWGEGCYQVQVNIPNVEGRRQPDYAFFRTAEERREADKRKGTLDYWRDVPALGDAKAWETSLDTQSSSGENPSAQVCNYLYRSRVRWGILTNGRYWRLYEQDKSRAGGIYYEINLVNLLDRGNGVFFKYFWLFFRREAFVPDPKSGLSFVENVFKGSVDYATGVGNRLKDSVYDALRHLMNGFLSHPANRLDAKEPAAVRLAHDNSLILLYRLLFILYAEDYGTLPCEMPQYSIYSLRAIHKEINKRLLSKPYPAAPAALWSRLCNLFGLIDQGFQEDGETVVPAYNGGLFSPEKHPHIAHVPQPNARHWQIGDRYLAEAIDLLAYDRKQWNKPTSDDVDYATLDVQHLGSIYEGLLELQPQVAEEPLVETTDKGKAVFRSEREVPDPRPIRGKRGQPPQPPRRIKAGEVYLVTNRGERRATGSYYTPKYIVDYIVENTVGSVAEEASKKVAELRAEADKEISKLQRTRREWEKSSARDAAEHIAGLNKLIEEQKRRLLEPYLALRILDPAMGSGHFLVGAADSLSLAMANDPNLLPLEEMGAEKPQPFYKRLIVERCLYGVDLNPLAVELAKLSVWLHTVSRNKALSFLDHHFRCGNSLIGARIEDDLMKCPPQFDERGKLTKIEHDLVVGMCEALYAGPLKAILERLHEISDIPTHDAATEKAKETHYAELEKLRQKFRAVANCWLSPHFGAPVEFDQYQRAVSALRGPADEWQALTDEPWFRAAQAVAREKHFFHWELEFPEVFFDPQGFKPKEERGFDVVIGNPPYVFIISVPQDDRSYFSGFFATCDYRFDVYGLFIERGLQLLRENGSFGYIIPHSLLNNNSFKKLRTNVLERASYIRIIDFTDRVFKEASNEPMLLIIRSRTTPAKRPSVLESVMVASSKLANADALLDKYEADLVEHLPGCPFIVRGGKWLGRLFGQRETLRLGDISMITQGLRTGDNPRFLSYRATSASHRRVLAGADIDRYAHDWPGMYVLYDRESLDAPRDPLFWEATGKILVQEIRNVHLHRRIVACLDSDRHIGLNTTNAIVLKPQTPLSLHYALAIVSSNLMNEFFRACFVDNHIATQYLECIPIPRIAFTTAKGERARLLKEGKRLYEQMLVRMNRGGAR